ncbi:MAG TPA: type I methionyl aminopeptidase [Phycisphaerae bacterium]
MKETFAQSRRGIIIKSPREIALMRQAGALVYRVLTRMRELAAPGVTTGELSAVAEEMISATGATALFKGVKSPQARFPFPAALCISVNDEVVHGIPGPRRLKEGDVVSLDCGVRLDGYCGDAAVTLPIGNVSTANARLLEVTSAALDLAVEEIRPGRMWSEVARKVQQFVEGHRMSVVREFVGHGIGREMHEDPKVPNYDDRKQRRHDFRLEKGMTLAVEPMVNLGSAAVHFADADHWTVVTRDGRCAAHFEHTVAVTESAADVLTNGRME